MKIGATLLYALTLSIACNGQTLGQTPPLPVATATNDAIASAYARQMALVERRAQGVRPAGYKAGFALPGAYRGLGLPEPAIGVLFAQGLVPAATSIAVNPATSLVIEAEVGFTIAKRITRPIRTQAELKAAVSQIRPVIELPELDPAAGSRIGTNLIANNIGSERFIAGAPLAPDTVLGGSTAPRLYFDGKLVAEANPDMIALDPWETLHFMVNKALKIYGPVEAGQIFIVGSLIQFPHQKAGTYKADYGSFGKISFEAK